MSKCVTISEQALPGFGNIVKMAHPPKLKIANPKSSAPIQARLHSATKPAMVEAAPNRWVPLEPESPVPDITLARWHPNGDGTYTAVPFTEPMIRVDQRLINLLGFLGQWQTLTRLGRAGFVEMVRMAPFTTLLNLNSYYNHLARCAEDPEFWDEGKGNIEEYRKYIY